MVMIRPKPDALMEGLTSDNDDLTSVADAASVLAEIPVYPIREDVPADLWGKPIQPEAYPVRLELSKDKGPEVYPVREDVPADLWGKPIQDKVEKEIDMSVPPTDFDVHDEIVSKFRYGEDKMLKECLQYIGTTYAGHYVGKEEIQTTDVWHTLGSAATTTRDTAIKYLMRYGKKDGYNRKDLLKAVHYIVLLAHFTEDE